MFGLLHMHTSPSYVKFQNCIVGPFSVEVFENRYSKVLTVGVLCSPCSRPNAEIAVEWWSTFRFRNRSAVWQPDWKVMISRQHLFLLLLIVSFLLFAPSKTWCF